MDDIPELDVLDRYAIAGRGDVYVVSAPYQMNRHRPEITGRLVRLDGRLWRVMAVERRLPRSPIQQGEEIGLLVEPAAG